MAEFDLKGRHLVVAIPTYDGKVPVDLMISYMKSVSLMRKHGVTCTLETKSYCALIDKARSELAHSFMLRSNATDFLFVDADIGWEPEHILRLLAWSTNRGIVAGMYPVKQDETKFHVVLEPGPDGCIIQDKDGLIKAQAVSTGFMMIRRHVFNALFGAYPDLRYEPRRGEFKGQELCNYFYPMITDKTLYGEDISFCRRWIDIEGEIWIDPEIRLRHHGVKIYDADFSQYLLNTKQTAAEAA